MSATQTSTIVRHTSKTSFATLLTAAAVCSALIAAPAHAQRSFSRSGQHGSVNASSSVKGNTINGQASVNGSRGGSANGEGSATYNVRSGTASASGRPPAAQPMAAQPAPLVMVPTPPAAAQAAAQQSPTPTAQRTQVVSRPARVRRP